MSVSNPGDVPAEEKARSFYDKEGWSADTEGHSLDARLWEDLRPAAKDYVSNCRRRISLHLPAKGDFLLDAGSGPVQYPEYLEFSRKFTKHYCVDISVAALNEAKKNLGEKGEYFKATLLNLPFDDDFFDAAVSLHTIYHIDRKDQEQAVRELIRVTKPRAPLIIIYANPQRPGNLIKTSIRRVLGVNTSIRRVVGIKPKPSLLYYHAYPLNWWSRFEDVGSVEIKPWRMLTAGSSKRFIPNSEIGKKLFRSLTEMENNWEKLSVTLGAYPMIIINKDPRMK